MRILKLLPMVCLIVLLSAAPFPPVSALAASVLREAPEKITVGEPFEVILKIDGQGPLALGIIETLPPGCRFDDISGVDAQYRLDSEKGRLALAVFEPGELRYRATASSEPNAPFLGAYVDLLAVGPDPDLAPDRFDAIKPAAKPIGPILPPAAGGETAPGRLPGDADGDGRLTRDETIGYVCDYLLQGGPGSLDDVCDAAYVHTLWDGRPKTLTDMDQRPHTFYRPVERIITTNPDNSMIIIALGREDLIVGTDECTIGSCVCARRGNRMKHPKAAPNCWATVRDGNLDQIPQTSTRKTINYELMATLAPDVIFETTFWSARADNLGQKVGAPVVVAGTDFMLDTWFGQIETIGRVLDRPREAAALAAFCQGKIDRVADITRTIPEKEKPRVYFAPRGAGQGFFDPKEGRDFTRTFRIYDPLDLAGGINVAGQVTGNEVNVSVEQIIAWNPEFILVACSTPEDSGVQFLIDAPELASIEAMKKSQVYNVMYPHCRGRPIHRNLFNIMLFAKLLHPDRFKDLDLEQEGNEIYQAFLGIEGGFTEYAEYLEYPLAYLEKQSPK